MGTETAGEKSSAVCMHVCACGGGVGGGVLREKMPFTDHVSAQTSCQPLPWLPPQRVVLPALIPCGPQLQAGRWAFLLHNVNCHLLSDSWGQGPSKYFLWVSCLSPAL